MEKFFGNYRAEVIDDLDEMEAGRVKIRVFGIHDNLEDDQLPWAIYSDPFMGGAENLGGLFVPDIGSHIWIFFEAGDIQQPVYFAGAPAKPHMPEEKATGYPRTKVFKTKAGFVFEIDDSEDATRLKITQPSGNVKECDHDGNVHDVIQGNLVIDVEGSVKFTSPSMQFGEDDDVEQSVLGKQLEIWINDILTPWLNQIQVIGNQGSPTSTPIVPFDPSIASPSGALYSKKNTNQ